MTVARTPLSPEELAELQAILEEELARLRRSLLISEATSGPVALDQTAVGRLSRMDAMQSQAMQQGLQERQRARVGALEAALRRVASGEYGICRQCGVPIPYGRLLVIPEASTCARCGGR